MKIYQNNKLVATLEKTGACLGKNRETEKLEMLGNIWELKDDRENLIDNLVMPFEVEILDKEKLTFIFLHFKKRLNLNSDDDLEVISDNKDSNKGIIVLDIKEIEYRDKYKEDVRFFFGFHNGNGSKSQHEAKGYEEYVVLVYAEKFIPLALANDYDTKFVRSAFCKTRIEIDYANESLIIPDFFKENGIDIIPVYRKNDKDITQKEFFKVAKKKGIKELKYITFGLFGYGNAKSEYEWLKAQKLGGKKWNKKQGNFGLCF